MTTNPDPPETSSPPPGVSVPPENPPQNTKPEGRTGRRGRPRGPAKAKEAPKELDVKELAALGLLQVEAAKIGQSVEDFVADLRAMIKAHDRLLEVVGTK